jgi:serine/threonine protein kinase
MSVMTEKPDLVETPSAFLDPLLVDGERLNTGLARKDFAIAAGIVYHTYQSVLRGNAVTAQSAKLIATKLGKKVTDLLSPRDPRFIPTKDLAAPWSGASEWELVGFLDQSRWAPNGLYYHVCQMRHRHTAARRGRGKFYLLSCMLEKTKQDVQHKLSRHADVCERVKLHPHLAVNHTSTPIANNEGWWVIDDWVGERTVADHLQTAPWPPGRLARLLHEIVFGLAALHTAGVILRELAPSRVLISDLDGRAVLTDFELAKLLDGSPTVSSEWPEDPYRAPEVGRSETTVRADLYSFGKLVLATVGCDLNDPNAAPVALGKAGVPKRLARLVLDCVDPIPSGRPRELGPVANELDRWVRK